MTIRGIHIEKFSAVNALVGPNDSGKSNILRALNLVLGETWPRAFADNIEGFDGAINGVNI